MVLSIMFTEARLPFPMHMVVGRLRERALRFVMAEWKEEQGNEQQKEKCFANHAPSKLLLSIKSLPTDLLLLLYMFSEHPTKKTLNLVMVDWKKTKKSAERGVLVMYLYQRNHIRE